MVVVGGLLRGSREAVGVDVVETISVVGLLSGEEEVMVTIGEEKLSVEGIVSTISAVLLIVVDTKAGGVASCMVMVVGEKGCADVLLFSVTLATEALVSSVWAVTVVVEGVVAGLLVVVVAVVEGVVIVVVVVVLVVVRRGSTRSTFTGTSDIFSSPPLGVTLLSCTRNSAR
jgi:hypothetical protein